MSLDTGRVTLDELKQMYPKKFASEEKIFSRIHRGDRIFGQYAIDTETHATEVAFVVRDNYQNQGIGTELLTYLIYLAKKRLSRK